MNLADLETFVVVADAKSVVTAASRLHLSQSAVTRRLQSLETALGTVLIHREARPLVLTPEGAEAYRHAKNILSSADDMRAAMEPNAEMRGEFRLGISMSLGEMILNHPIERLRNEFPKLQLQAVVAESSHLLGRVERRELDAVVILLIDGRQIPEGLAGEHLDNEPLCVVAAKGLKIGKSPSLKDLQEFPWALNPEGCNARDELRIAHNRLHLPLRIVMESASAELKFALIEKGLGLGLSRPPNIRTSRYKDGLTSVIPRDFARTVGMWLVYSPNLGRLRAPLRCLREALQAETQARPSENGSE